MQSVLARERAVGMMLRTLELLRGGKSILARYPYSEGSPNEPIAGPQVAMERPWSPNVADRVSKFHRGYSECPLPSPDVLLLSRPCQVSLARSYLLNESRGGPAEDQGQRIVCRSAEPKIQSKDLPPGTGLYVLVGLGVLWSCEDLIY